MLKPKHKIYKNQQTCVKQLHEPSINLHSMMNASFHHKLVLWSSFRRRVDMVFPTSRPSLLWTYHQEQSKKTYMNKILEDATWIAAEPSLPRHLLLGAACVWVLSGKDCWKPGSFLKSGWCVRSVVFSSRVVAHAIFPGVAPQPRICRPKIGLYFSVFVFLLKSLVS